MRTNSAFRSCAISTLLCSLCTLVLSGPSGMNCNGKGCGWDCNGGSCSQAFADVLTGRYQPGYPSPSNPGLSDDAIIHDGQQLACFADVIGDNGLCAYVYGLGSATTTGANMKLVAQDLANHCSECGQAPINRVGNQLKGGWYQIQSTPTNQICSTTNGGLGLCPQS